LAFALTEIRGGGIQAAYGCDTTSASLAGTLA
jgi:hypothetical protein